MLRLGHDSDWCPFQPTKSMTITAQNGQTTEIMMPTSGWSQGCCFKNMSKFALANSQKRSTGDSSTIFWSCFFRKGGRPCTVVTKKWKSVPVWKPPHILKHPSMYLLERRGGLGGQNRNAPSPFSPHGWKGEWILQPFKILLSFYCHFQISKETCQTPV